MTRVLLLAPRFPAEGGMSQLGRTMCRLLRDIDLDVAWIDSSGRNPVRVAGMWRSLAIGLARSDVLHVIASSGTSLWGKVLPAMGLARALGKKIVLHFVGGMAVEAAGEWSFLKRLPFSWAHLTVVPASSFRNGLEACGLRARYRVIPNTVAVEPFLHMQREDTGKVLLAVKGLHEHAGHDHLLQVLALVRRQHPDVELWIAGDGPERSRLVSIAEKLSLTESVRFLGAVPHDEIPRLYARASVFVHAPRYESFGLVLVEAMAAGLPIVAVAVGGIPDVVGHGCTGILVPFGEVEQFAEAVGRFLRDATLRERTGEVGRGECRRFTVEAVGPLWARVYKELLA